MRIVVSQLGARMHYAVPRAFHEAGMLERFDTDVCAVSPGFRPIAALIRALPRAAAPAALRRFAQRVPAGVPRELIRSFPLFGVAFARRRGAARNQAEHLAVMLEGGRVFSRKAAARGFGRADALYAFNGGALEQLEAARRAGLATLLEQCMAPWAFLDAVMEEELARLPDWDTGGERPSAASRAFAARERAEWALADVIVCGSDFVKDTLRAYGGPAERCVVVPYGYDPAGPPPTRVERAPGPLRVLTVGEVGLRKGTPAVLEAALRLGARITVRMVGPIAVPDAVRARLADAVELVGVVPRGEIARHLAWADAFLLPSLCEGSATATYEALAAGLPVIATPNTGSVVRDGEEGFIVPVRDVDAIVDALARLAGDRRLCARMSEAAAFRAGAFSVSRYGERLRAALAVARSQAAEAA